MLDGDEKGTSGKEGGSAKGGGGHACFGKWRCKEVGTTPPPEEGKTFAK